MMRAGRGSRAARWLKLWPRRTAALAFVLPLVLAMCGSGAGALAAVGTCNLPPDPRGTTIGLTEKDARAELTVTRPNSAGRKFKIEYNDETFIGKFDTEGRALLVFALIAPVNEIFIRLAEVPVITCKVMVPDFGRIFRVVMRWRDPVRLDLDIVEPGRQSGGYGHINRGRPNADMLQGIGMMDVISDPIDDGATGELSYVVPNGGTLLSAGIPTFRMDYLSRGNRPEPPYCGDHDRATVPFELYVISRGDVKRSNFNAARARCGEVMADAARLMRLRH